MLKPDSRKVMSMVAYQPPLGGCVLKHTQPTPERGFFVQPPLGGCVLKPFCEYGRN